MYFQKLKISRQWTSPLAERL